MATGSVSHVDHVGQGIGCMNRTGHRSWSLVAGRWARTHGSVEIAIAFGSGPAFGTQVVEEQLLLSGEEAELQPAENVVHDRLGKADVGIV